MGFKAGRSVSRDVYKLTRDMVRAGQREKPGWLEAYARYPPISTARPSGKLPQIVFAEDRLRTRFERRYPNAVDVFRLYEEDAARAMRSVPSERFVARQTALMAEGLSEDAAFDQLVATVDANEDRRAAEYGVARQQALRAGLQSGASVLDDLMDLEEDVLRENRDMDRRVAVQSRMSEAVEGEDHLLNQEDVGVHSEDYDEVAELLLRERAMAAEAKPERKMQQQQQQQSDRKMQQPQSQQGKGKGRK